MTTCPCTAPAWRLVLTAALLLLATAVAAQGPRAVRKQVESTLLLTGTIQIDAEGRVSAFTLDHRDRMPAAALQLTDRAIPTWRFRPVLHDGVAVPASTRMRVRLVASRLGEDQYKVEVRSTSFGVGRAHAEGVASAEPDQAFDDTVSGGSIMTPPPYPTQAAAAGVTGTVYLVLRLDEAGAVSDAFAEQTNLKVIASENELVQWRRLLEQAALRAARQWRIDPFPPAAGNSPATSPATSSGQVPAARLVRVPIEFVLLEQGETPAPAEPGTWESYVPGPRKAAPWMPSDPQLAGGVDALAPGDVLEVGQSLQLLPAPGSG